MDGLRHINHAAYLSYMETARLDFYIWLGFDPHRWDDENSTILVSMKVDYIGQVTHPAILEIGQRISRVGTKSFDLLTAIFLREESRPVVQALFTLVAYNYLEQRSIPVPEVFRRHCREL
jgi:acyl-CoA thioester hydrolase